MLYWAAVFLVIAIIAGLLGFTSVAVISVGIAKILFTVFLTLFIIMLAFVLILGKKLRGKPPL